jgi:hypothetical protein
MKTIQGGTKRTKPGKREDGMKVGRRKDDVVDDTKLPTKIEVKALGQLKTVVPGHVWRTPPFKWRPVTFSTESEQLNNKFVEPSIQDRSLADFLDDPTTPMIYGVAGSPDDSKAKYFAAFLVAAHIKALGADANPVWATMYGGFDNPYIHDEKAKPTILVISNLTPNSTGIKLEKARDLLEHFADIPRIVVIAGMDPMSFLTTRLFSSIHGLAFFSEGLVKQKVEII